MSRRTHERFDVSPAPSGIVRVLRTVAVEHVSNHEIVVVSADPGQIGEDFSIDLFVPERPRRIAVRVTDCVPTIHEGLSRYRLRLVFQDAPPESSVAPARTAS